MLRTNQLHHLLLLLIFSGVLISGCSKKITGMTRWAEQKIVVDGKPDDWQLPLKYYDRESLISYDIANDRENLYIIIRATENEAQVKILRQGMRFSIDASGSENFPVELFYPLPDVMTHEDRKTQDSNPGDLLETKNYRKNFLLSQTQLRLIGFNNTIPNGLMPVSNSYGITAALGWDHDNILYYEAVIPFSTFYKPQLTIADTVAAWSFRITIDGLIQPREGGKMRDMNMQQRNSTGGNALLSNSEFATGNAHIGSDQLLAPRTDQEPPSADPLQSQSQLFVASRILFKLKLVLK